MTDFHTHILPGIDDGSRDIEMTARMLEAERDQGVTRIYATPHFYAHRVSIAGFLENRAKALEETRALIASRPGLPEVIAGAEVLYFSGISKADQLPSLCVEDSDILLLEMPFSQWRSDMAGEIESLLSRRKLRVVLAHVERYEQFQKDKSVYREILDMPLTIQINAGSFIAPGFHGRSRQKLAFRLLAEHPDCIIGSDCHNLGERRPNLADARAAIERKAGAARLAALDAYTESFLG